MDILLSFLTILFSLIATFRFLSSILLKPFELWMSKRRIIEGTVSPRVKLKSEVCSCGWKSCTLPGVRGNRCSYITEHRYSLTCNGSAHDSSTLQSCKSAMHAVEMYFEVWIGIFPRVVICTTVFSPDARQLHFLAMITGMNKWFSKYSVGYLVS